MFGSDCVTLCACKRYAYHYLLDTHTPTGVLPNGVNELMFGVVMGDKSTMSLSVYSVETWALSKPGNRARQLFRPMRRGL